MLDARQLEPALNEQQIFLRDNFVQQYLIDFDAYKACLRLGFQAVYAVQHSHILINDGYVQRKLAYLTRMPEEDPMEEAADKALCKMTLRKVMHNGSDSARVSAVGKMTVIHGWDHQAGDDSTDDDLAEMFKRVAEMLPS